MMIRVLFLLLGLGTIGLVMAMGGGLVFIDAASTVVVIVPSVLLAAGYHGPGALGAAISAADGEEPVEAGLGAKHRQVLQSLRALLCACGGLGFLIGLVHMLQNLSDPTAVGPALAVALLTGLYAVIASELIVAPLIGRVQVLEPSEAVVGQQEED
ncbi:MAG: hypothetical protein CMH55_08980 [Myxococcales bacterium]|nr:hypothetical protein [Myxococcales bacterium]